MVSVSRRGGGFFSLFNQNIRLAAAVADVELLNLPFDRSMCVPVP